MVGFSQLSHAADTRKKKHLSHAIIVFGSVRMLLIVSSCIKPNWPTGQYHYSPFL